MLFSNKSFQLCERVEDDLRTYRFLVVLNDANGASSSFLSASCDEGKVFPIIKHASWAERTELFMFTHRMTSTNAEWYNIFGFETKQCLTVNVDGQIQLGVSQN